METEVESALSRMDLFNDVPMNEIRTARLGGLTNRNYEIESPVGHFVLRIPGEGTGDIIDRQVEEHNARIAAQAGVNAEVLYFDAAEGTMLCRYVEKSVTMSPAGFKDPGAVERAAHAFRRLHTCGRSFRTRFELFQQIDNYLAVVKKLQAPIPDGYAGVQREAEAVRDALGAHALPVAPCHCDPLAENFLDVGNRMFIVDFEYSGNNDPMWDLGDLSVEGEFDEKQDGAFLSAYFNGRPPAFDAGRMVMYKAMCDLLWTLWGVVQFANDNPAEDFWTYSVNRLNRCRTLMSSDGFPHQLEAVRRGP
ncbi:MAG TPA: phosphotransferase [Alphaproteobacteria bacterium]|nr:phosphotransferase [Alphaproteobacteria bacterium]